ncbi:MAG: RidA family protein [Deltaproteobacteria bacterium]|nr:MAG: RidA family protein [Deltaproteobacteria bacterium]
MKKVIAPKNLHRPFGYAHAIQIDKTLYISGQIPLDMDMNVVGKNDMAAQTEQVYGNLKRVLEDAGGSMKNIVMLNIYCTDVERFDKETRGMRKKYFGDYYPAVTAVEVKRLYRPDFMIEVEAVAVLDNE